MRTIQTVRGRQQMTFKFQDASRCLAHAFVLYMCATIDKYKGETTFLWIFCFVVWGRVRWLCAGREGQLGLNCVEMEEKSRIETSPVRVSTAEDSNALDSYDLPVGWKIHSRRAVSSTRRWALS